jgi:ribosomal protein S18 acetylase RimI-like enzyme
MTPRVDGVRIRVGTPETCGSVLELWAAAGAEPSVTDTVEALLRLLDTDARALLIAVVDGEVVGSVIAGWNGWRGSLYRLAVHPRYRRGRVATQLVHEGERRLRELGATRVDAIVTDDDTAAVRFWTAVGYRHHEHRVRFVRDLR